MTVTGCLLLHGYGGSPFEMEPLANALRDDGHLVSVPCLPGHGENLSAFGRTGFADWLGGAESAFMELAGCCDRVFAMGLSMGGTLALALAERHSPAGVVCLAAPVYIYRFIPWRMQDWRLAFLPIIARFVPVMRRSPPRPESRAIAPWQGYEEAHCPPQLLSLSRGARQVKKDLGKVQCPMLIMQDRGDRTVHPDNALEIAAAVSSERVELIRTAIRESITGRHLLTTHQETRELVQRACREFVRSLA